MPANAPRDDRAGAGILGCHIDALGWDEVLERVGRWARRGESRYVCVCNVHSVVTARRQAEFRRVVNAADAATCDGMPLVWFLRRHGFPLQQRIDGPELMWRYCARAAATGEGVFLYGGTAASLALLSRRLRLAFPALRLAGSYAPPFRDLTPAEEAAVAAMIERCGARVVFVGLGCPKQELWMARNRGRVHAVMIGVGAAFDFHAGLVRRAPSWMRSRGLEWLYRLGAEPRRLWRRYLVTNSLFLGYLLGQWIRGALARRGNP